MTVRWENITAVFGGSFDPPHLGHREGVLGLFQNPGVGRVVILPAGKAPQKNARLSAEQRLELVKLGLGAERPFPFSAEDPSLWERVSISTLELERARTHPGEAQYSYDSLLALQSGEREVGMVIGIDQLRNLPHWSRFPDVLRVAHWIVLERKPDSLLSAEAVLRDWEASGLLRRHTDREWWIQGSPIGYGGARMLRVCPTPARNLSSSEIREAIVKHGVPPSATLHPQVEAELKRRLF